MNNAVYLREIDSGTDNACWVVCNRVDNDAVAFIPDETEALAKWMIVHGMATGHGDTIEDLIVELVHTCAERAQSVTANRYGEQSEDWQNGFDRGGNAAANAVREIIHPQQPTKNEQ